MHAQAEALFDLMTALVGRHLPPGVSPSYFDGFVRRNRPALVAVLDRHLEARQANRPGSSPPDAPDLWSAAKRTAANLRAMRIAASKRPEEMGAEDRAALAAYSGWGGLSIQAVADQFPTGFPVPEDRGLIHQRVRYCNFQSRSDPTAARPSRCGAPGWAGRRLRRRPPLPPLRRARGSPPRASRCR